MEKIRLFLKTHSPLKVLLWALGGIVVLIILVSLIGVLFRPVISSLNNASQQLAFYDGGVSSGSYATKGGYGESAMDSAMPELSVRNISPIMPPSPGTTVGSDAEAYEVTDYSAYYETGNLDRVCGDIQALKSYAYVVFENASQNDRSCQYLFKVEKSRAQEIKEVIESLNPKTLTESIRTIKPVLDDFTSTEQILKNKLTAIEDTLEEAQRSYDQLRVIATSARDAESLAKVIESKIKIIERLTTERLNLRAQLDSIGQAKSQQLDHLDYVYFNLSVYEKLVVDFEALGDTWVSALQEFVKEFNAVLQGVTLGVLKFGLYVIWAALYLLIVVLIGKYGWRLIKRIWKS